MGDVMAAEHDRGNDVSLGERLRSSRRASFVGRSAELAVFDGMLAADRPAFGLLWVHGPGGVGKTALCGMFAERARAAGRPVHVCDARDADMTPEALRAALGEPVPGQVTIVDTFERFAPLETWLRDSLLPGWPADGLLVVSGRRRPDERWLGDVGWQPLLRTLPLRNLRPDESRDYLRARGVVGVRQEQVIEFTHGHPLALALVAETLAQGRPLPPVRPEQEPELVRILLERLVEHVPGPRHRSALEVCAHVRVTTEETLAEVLGGDDTAELFAWLRGLSFAEHGPHGVCLHDLARDVLDADLRWRSPHEYRRLHAAARAAALRRVQATDGARQHRALLDFLFMHRNNPVMRHYQDWGSFGAVHTAPASPQALPELLSMVERYEGERSAALAEQWYRRQPSAFTAILDEDGEIVGLEATLSLHEASAEDIDADPATRAAMVFARRHGPPRPGDQVLYHRFAVSRDAYQAVSPGSSMFAVSAFRRWLVTPRLAWTFVALSDPDFWQPMFDYLNMPRVPEADFEVGRRYGVFSHDWRVEPPAAWFDLMEEREIEGTRAGGRPPAAETRPALVVLSEPEFRTAVRHALRGYTRLDVLAASPLLHSRVTVDQAAGDRPRPEDLRRVITEAAEALRGSPRDEKFYRAVHRTYLKPAPTQERAAEALGLPFSTYRSHLSTGIERISAWLWMRELAGPEPAQT
ncbi:ATP-binding protein [Nonomuraea aridisoli]|nr:ATP-binding protein [Nonomuraea aridisoli]